ncbi:type IV toxin-antitoxin system AbiEi family antitoxin domain-containing protein [Gulosibacter bifidus]|uniref:Type IV toxin-antitoxin system AbiEi family antitoxin domain-containing protein n=1 Tax=Gulosibacter bifidus TaxID=272239 RepID=A0ABW5RJ31_9MICO|nr:type IV toxin-antitoxin system AbiEi family antitoxin domain-containing protein [Gulosibacter bifidus]
MASEITNDTDQRLTVLLMQQHGVVTFAQLGQAGIGRSHIERLCSVGALERVRRGIYANTANLDPIGLAKRHGGVLTCLSALKYLGIWTPHHSELHVRTARYKQLIGASGHTLLGTPLPLDGIDVFTEAIRCAQRCCTRDELVAILDSAIAQIGRDNVELSLGAIEGKLLRAWELAGERADSGVESLLRVRLRGMRLKHVMHARIGNYEVDALVGSYLAIEVDGFAYHSAQAEFRRDREKDRFLAAKGFTVLRFTYWEVVDEWERCSASILAMVRAKRHRIPGRMAA